MTTETCRMVIGLCFNFALFIELMTAGAFLVFVLLVRKGNCKLLNAIYLSLAAIGNVAETRKQKARGVFRRGLHVAV